MKKILMSLYIVILYFSYSTVYAGSIDTKQANDPLKVHTYKLSNGLTVYLNEDHNTTSVFGAVVVNGGGKRDPKDATGIAHYLEHLLFKGTQEMGTIDYAGEKIYLDSIEIKYEELGNTLNENERLKIQTQINRLSIEASKYAIPNEFDRIIDITSLEYFENIIKVYDRLIEINIYSIFYNKKTGIVSIPLDNNFNIIFWNLELNI